MARRRAFHPIDTSDRLANVVVSSIALLIVALLALILWMTNSADPETTAASAQAPGPADTADGAAEPERVPAVDAATEGATATTPDVAAADGGATPDRDATAGTPGNDASGGDAGGIAGEAGTTPTPPATDATAGPTDGDLSDPGRGSGLFSADDPGRMPATTVRTSPRDELVVTADFDGDGRDERVRSAIIRDQVITSVERLVDGRWQPGRGHGGAPADRLVDLRARDLTGDGLPEVYTKQWVATEGESVTLWSVEDGSLQRMPVRGGCWADNNTVGLIGASVEVPDEGPALIVALCEDRTRPTQKWPSALYRWQQGAWTFDRLLGKYE